MMDWYLECSSCGMTTEPSGLHSVCTACGKPWLVRYPDRIHAMTERSELRRRQGMWRYRSFLPLESGEVPITLGEGDTPLLQVPRLGASLGFTDLWVKDEASNPTGSFKARGLSAAITRAVAAGAKDFVIPTAGNAGVASAAYAARAGARVKVFAPKTTPPLILAQIKSFGAELVLLEGHIGDCGKASRAWAAESGAMDLSTLREPYRIEGKKTLGLEIAMQLGWTMPSAIIYPTGGGTGLIGMWKAFIELREAGWVVGEFPRLFVVQSTGCAPVVRAWEANAEWADPWVDPWTVAAGLRVPGPLGDGLILRAVRETGGGAIAIPDEVMTTAAAVATRLEGVDFSPEGGATVAGAAALLQAGVLGPDERVVLCNTGSGLLYRDIPELLLRGE